jgi:ABC-2 type transport system permease protein
MRYIWTLAQKDLRLLFRNKAAVFFTFGWPLVIAVLFGAIFSAPAEQSGRIAIAVVDEDQTGPSGEFVAQLRAGRDLDVLATGREAAIALVRQGKRTSALILMKGFGEASQRLFYGSPPRLELWSDPSRKAEAGMIQGWILKLAAERFNRVFSDSEAMRNQVRQGLESLKSAPDVQEAERAPVARFLNELDAFLAVPQPGRGGTGGRPQWQPIEIEEHAIAKPPYTGPRSGYQVTFPQGILWGIISCIMTFSISFVTERTHGTLMRLQASPITRFQLLAGKSLACILAILIVVTCLMVIARLGFRVIPQSLPLFLLAVFSTMIAFVGMMMLLASLGKTEAAAAGTGWAIILPLTMLGGGMVPLFIMPGWLVTAGYFSPVRWGILALEGSIWRGFSLAEMAVPCAILVAIGTACFVAGVRSIRLDS